MKRNNYYDKNGVGLFTKWFKNEEMEIDEMEEELQDDNVDDCGYLDFDDNFPLDPSINDKDKQSKMFEIIQYCYRNGKPPSSKKGKEKENSNKKSNKNGGPYDDGSQVNKSFTIDSYWNSISSKELHKAIKEGKLEVLKYWGVEAIKNVKVLPARNALHMACEYGKLHIVKWLIDECGFNLEETDNVLRCEKTAFGYAVEGGSIEVLEFLKGKKAKMNVIAGYSNKNLLCWACEAYETSVLNYKNDDEKKDKIEVIKWLLNHSNRTKGSDFYINVEFTTGIGVTPFLWAAKRGLLAITQLLREKGANVDAKDISGDNALHMACLWSGSEAMVTWLLDVCKLDIETKGYAQKTPFLCAVQKGQLKLAKRLRKRGANIHAKNEKGNNALHMACLLENVEMTRWLLDECKLGLETKGQYERTPFLCAAKKGQLAIAKLLRKRGANIHAKNEKGNNALHMACLLENVEMTRWLLDVYQIGIETKGCDEKTPLLCAARGESTEIVSLLIEKGANINAKDKDGKNALYYANMWPENLHYIFRTLQ